LEGWNHYHNSDKRFYEYHQSHPAMAKRFAGAMASFVNAHGNAPSFLAELTAYTRALVKIHPTSSVSLQSVMKTLHKTTRQNRRSTVFLNSQPIQQLLNHRRSSIKCLRLARNLHLTRKPTLFNIPCRIPAYGSGLVDVKQSAWYVRRLRRLVRHSLAERFDEELAAREQSAVEICASVPATHGF
jgi:hypothetical protein